LGVNFLRFDDIDVKTDIGFVIEEIEAWIGQNRPTPNPCPTSPKLSRWAGGPPRRGLNIFKKRKDIFNR